MMSIINQLSSSAELALEGFLYQKRSLGVIDNYKLTFIADIRQNYVVFALEFIASDKEFTISTDKVWTYNTMDMASALVKFLLGQLLYKVYNDERAFDDLQFIKELQDRFDEAFGMTVAIV